MFITYEQPSPHRREIVARHETFAAAFYELKANPACLFIEEDADYPGEAADAFMAGGSIRSIQHENFKLKENRDAA